MTTYRYLHYAIDKHQNHVTMYEDLPEQFVLQNCDDGFDVVVDLVAKKRYWLGKWEDVDLRAR